MEASRTAVFWDLENTAITIEKLWAISNPRTYIPAIMAQIRAHGSIEWVRAYYDARQFRSSLRRCLEVYGARSEDTPSHIGPYGRPKSSVDLVMALDVVETAIDHHHIDRFVLITGDRDYIRLVNRLRYRWGKSVVVMGIAGQTSEDLIRAANTFEVLNIPGVPPRSHDPAPEAAPPQATPPVADATLGHQLAALNSRQSALIRYLAQHPPSGFNRIVTDVCTTTALGPMTEAQVARLLRGLISRGCLVRVERRNSDESTKYVWSIQHEHAAIKAVLAQRGPTMPEPHDMLHVMSAIPTSTLQANGTNGKD